jgi:hypothetical protein
VLTHHATIAEEPLLALLALQGGIKLQNNATHRKDLVEPLRCFCRQFLCLNDDRADGVPG